MIFKAKRSNTVAVVSDFSASNPLKQYARSTGRGLKGKKVSFANTKAITWLYNPVLASDAEFKASMDKVFETVKACQVTHLHLELGLYGNSLEKMRENVLGIIHNAKSMVVFVHSLHMKDQTFAPLYAEILQLVAEKIKQYPCKIWVNNPKDHNAVKAFIPAANIVYYPVVYFSDRQREFFIRRAVGKKANDNAPEKKYVIGVFGFINAHKDFETTLKALALLPKNYHLAIVGGAHPGERKINQKNESIAALDKAMWDLREFGIMDRISFHDGLGDVEFFDMMAGLDAVIINYLETQMSASSVLSQSLELKVPVVASRCTTLEMAREHFGDVLEFFEPGNSVQLRQKIMLACEKKQPPKECKKTVQQFCDLIDI